VNGQTDFGALQVEIDAPVDRLNQPVQAAAVTVWGVSLQQIGQAKDFNGKKIRVSGGMAKGLPLANPAQAGVLVEGVIQQAYGNWIETNQWVRFIITPGDFGVTDTLNIVVNWQAGQPMSTAIRNTLETAAPKASVQIAISDKLVLAADEHATFRTLTQFAQYCDATSKSIITEATYPGVSILIRQDNFVVFDNTFPGAAVPLSFTDLIGQPTWIDPGTVQVTTVMRADLAPGDLITLPPTIVTTAPANPLVGIENKSIFQGTFIVNQMRHVGNFRQPDAGAWVTTMNCSPQ